MYHAEIIWNELGGRAFISIASRSCLPGEIQLTGDSPSCGNCKPGTFTNVTTTRESNVYYPTACTSCDVGAVAALEGASSCTLCPVGRYMDQPGASSCKACEPDFFSDAPGASSCTKCRPGSFTVSDPITKIPLTAQSECEQCKKFEYVYTDPATKGKQCVQFPVIQYVHTQNAAADRDSVVHVPVSGTDKVVFQLRCEGSCDLTKTLGSAEEPKTRVRCKFTVDGSTCAACVVPGELDPIAKTAICSVPVASAGRGDAIVELSFNYIEWSDRANPAWIAQFGLGRESGRESSTFIVRYGSRQS